MLQWNEKRIDEMKRGDALAQESCYHEFSTVLYTAILKICRNSSNARDLLQDTFLDAFENIHQYNKNYAFIAWLKRIAFNNTFNFLKRERVASNAITYLKNSVSTEPAPLESLSQSNQLEYLLSIVTENERLVLWLFFVEQYSHKEISQLVGKSESYSKSIVSRSLKKIQQRVEVQAHAY